MELCDAGDPADNNPFSSGKTFAFYCVVLFFNVYFSAKSEWENFKFFWTLGLRPSYQDRDSAEIDIKSYVFQEVCDEFEVTRRQRRTKSQALKLIKKWCGGEDNI